MKKLWKKAFIVTCLIAYLKKKHARNVIKEGYVGHKQFFLHAIMEIHNS